VADTALTAPVERIRWRGSRIARGLLALGGWRVECEGLPGRQGVIVVYPHTSNWDFIAGLLAKWALGLQVRFWGKDSLFRVPLMGAWMRWLGGVAINRSAASGVVGDTVRQLVEARARGELFWLALAPEGTRSLTPGWRSGFYRVALKAEVPLVVATLDFGRRCVRLVDGPVLTGEAERDIAAIAACIGDVRGCRPALAAPITWM
jgi:1-acyl-sn-glycerol-3-phosphate acyltransferase